jgi:ribosomal protein L12E/L44/L45/RPP1/RPP2
MKSVVAVVASLFAVSAFAQAPAAPAKKEEAKPAAAAPAKKEEKKEAKAEVKKEEKKTEAKK